MRTREIPSVIANAGTTGSAVDLGAGTEAEMVLAGIVVPAAYDKTTITFEASINAGSTWFPIIQTDGTALEYTCTASTLQGIAVPPTDLCGFKYIRPKAPSAVGAECTFTFIARLP